MLQVDVWETELENLKTQGTGFSIYLVNGIKLQFQKVIAYDDFCLKACDANGTTQTVTLHAISTLVPTRLPPAQQSRQ